MNRFAPSRGCGTEISEPGRGLERGKYVSAEEKDNRSSAGSGEGTGKHSLSGFGVTCTTP